MTFYNKRDNIIFRLSGFIFYISNKFLIFASKKISCQCLKINLCPTAGEFSLILKNTFDMILRAQCSKEADIFLFRSIRNNLIGKNSSKGMLDDHIALQCDLVAIIICQVGIDR